MTSSDNVRDATRVPDVSVVSVNYKVAEHLSRMIASVPLALATRSYEIIVVDNASGDGSVERLRREHAGIDLVESPDNLGFARGNNLGAARARGTYLALVNPDVVLPARSLAVLVDFLEAHPRAGLVGPRVELPDGSTQSHPGTVPSSWDVLRAIPGAQRAGRALERLLDQELELEHPVPCGAIHGSCMVFTRAAFEAIGGMPAHTFMYGEEMLLGHSLDRLGYEVWYHPLVTVHHQDDASASQRWQPHEKALRKRWAHAVARSHILPRPAYLAWNALMASSELVRSVSATLRNTPEAAEYRDFARLHLDAIAKSGQASPIPFFADSQRQ